MQSTLLPFNKDSEANKSVSEKSRYKKTRSLGICLGASTISIAQVEQEQVEDEKNPII